MRVADVLRLMLPHVPLECFCRCLPALSQLEKVRLECRPRWSVIIDGSLELLPVNVGDELVRRFELVQQTGTINAPD